MTKQAVNWSRRPGALAVNWSPQLAAVGLGTCEATVDGEGGGAAGAALEDGGGGAAATVAPFPKKKSSTGEDDTQGICSPLDARETLCCVLLKIASYVAKAKKGERGPIRFRMRATCSLAEIDEVRIVGMKCEHIPRKPLAQNTQ